MIRTITHDDVIRYVYHETSKEEGQEIEQAIICDSDLQMMFKEINGVKIRLDEVQRTPSKMVINNILNYSKSLNLLSKK
jgi:hypothetical protein